MEEDYEPFRLDSYPSTFPSAFAYPMIEYSLIHSVWNFTILLDLFLDFS
jgi:hypothetical protein